MEPVIEIRGVSKRFDLQGSPVTALRDVNLTVEKGEFLAIVGPSGSGKTTLFNIIGCIEKPSAGTVRLAGRDVTPLSFDELASFRAENIGFVFQTFNLIPVLTALENVEYPLLRRRLPAPERRRRAQELLEKVGLKNHLRHAPPQMSGGQRQRVAIARALVTSPSIVLADEPTANLDHDTSLEIIALMKELNRSLSLTFVFSTNDEKIMAAASRVLRVSKPAAV